MLLIVGLLLLVSHTAVKLVAAIMFYLPLHSTWSQKPDTNNAPEIKDTLKRERVSKYHMHVSTRVPNEARLVLKYCCTS